MAAPTLATVLAEQADPAYQATLARQRHAAMTGKVWHYDARTGLTLLIPVLDGTTGRAA